LVLSEMVGDPANSNSRAAPQQELRNFSPTKVVEFRFDLCQRFRGSEGVYYGQQHVLRKLTSLSSSFAGRVAVTRMKDLITVVSHRGT
jgi:hypothetical protein